MKIILLGLLLIAFNFSSGQLFIAREKDRVFNPERYATSLISLDAGEFERMSIPGLGKIDIIDARADTFTLGYMKKGLFRNYKKIRFATPGMSQLRDFCSKIVLTDTLHGQYNMLIVVKELWLSEEDTDMDDKDKMQDINERLYQTSNVKVNFEFYWEEGGRYYPVCRFDTALFKTLPLKTYASEYIETALALGITKAMKYDFKRISTTKSPHTAASIHDFNNRRFRYRILNDTGLQKGVYVSFEEFKKNAPSVDEYEIKRGSLGDVLYTRSATGNWVVSRSVWGYSDGKNAFIRSGDNYFQLFRVGNSFYFNGSREITRAEYYSNNEKTTTYQNILSPLKVNIETGTTY